MTGMLLGNRNKSMNAMLVLHCYLYSSDEKKKRNPMKEKDNAFQEQDTVIWSALRQHVGRRQQKVLAGEKLQRGISEQMAPSSNPCREAEQSVSSHCCRGTSLCIPPRDMLYLRKPLAEYINRQKVNTCKELKGASLSLQFQKIFFVCLFIKIKNKPMPKKIKKNKRPSNWDHLL